ncbi:phosphoribosyltransferase [Natronomonas salina]|uniref:phosphoribosyltransferase n=1 Tax=Natronomonas salina TaxID=1710540 RepID=UPI0015B3BA91|nr:phosphoribosyltransferase family protein [Natronomonas salina]QLD88152.1 phosphoribosyltransferase [Natronomonas salina]
MFADRADAGRQLAAELQERGVAADLVLAVPRGGLPLGRAVADRLGAPLDIVAAKKLGAPGNPELAVGAAASDGSLYLNDDLVERLDLSDTYVENEGEKAAATAREKEATYRTGAAPDLGGKRVVVVDDGLATGATAIACIRKAKAEGASHVVLAVPVGAPGSVDEAAAEADEVVVLETPRRFGAVGSHYRDFSQVSDEAVMAYLEP